MLILCEDVLRIGITAAQDFLGFLGRVCVSFGHLWLSYGTLNGDRFLDFLRGSLIPEMSFDGMSAQSVLVLDTARALYPVHGERAHYGQ